MSKAPGYDIAFVGNYTKDTIVSALGVRQTDGGACNYGANVAVRMGLRTALITHLAEEDFHVVDALRRLGVHVFARATPESTTLRLEYPTANVDERIIYVVCEAGTFTPEEVQAIDASAIVVGATMHGEVGLDVIEVLSKKDTRLAVDVQGFVRAVQHGKLAHKAWREQEQVLSRVDILKTDAVEARILTGQADIEIAARALADQGPGEVVLTHRDGLLVYANGQYCRAGFFPQKLVGRSGRGDTCLAAYVAKRLSVPPAEAMIWAAAVTSLKMEAEGPFRKDIREVEELIERVYDGR
jgi:sugar/nucleoside kinase (ribokinase family)